MTTFSNMCHDSEVILHVWELNERGCGILGLYKHHDFPEHCLYEQKLWYSLTLPLMNDMLAQCNCELRESCCCFHEHMEILGNVFDRTHYT